MDEDRLVSVTSLEAGHNSPEARRQVDAHVLVSLLESAVFADEVQVVAADDDGTLHLHFTNDSGENSASDRDHAGEGAFLVNVVTRDGLK